MESDEPGLIERYHARIAEFAEELRPKTASQRFALETAATAAVEATYFFEAICSEVDSQRFVAQKRWDIDQRAKALSLAAQLPQNPLTIVGQLERSKAGCLILITHWQCLLEALDQGASWNDEEASIVLDLLAIPRQLRRGCVSIICPKDCTNLTLYQKQLADSQVDRLDDLLATMLVACDAADQERQVSCRATRKLARMSHSREIALKRFERFFGKASSSDLAELPLSKHVVTNRSKLPVGSSEPPPQPQPQTLIDTGVAGQDGKVRVSEDQKARILRMKEQLLRTIAAQRPGNAGGSANTPSKSTL